MAVRRFRHKEDSLQVACVEWFSYNYQGIKRLLHHSPNGGQRNAIEAAKFKRMGVQPGFPDLFLAIPNETYHGLFLELKTDKGRQSEYQKDMEMRLEERGYKYQVIRTTEEFIETIKAYLSNVQVSSNPSANPRSDFLRSLQDTSETCSSGPDVSA